MCDICKKIIDGRSLILGEKHFHADCFVCKKCEQPLTGWSFFSLPPLFLFFPSFHPFYFSSFRLFFAPDCSTQTYLRHITVLTGCQQFTVVVVCVRIHFLEMGFLSSLFPLFPFPFLLSLSHHQDLSAKTAMTITASIATKKSLPQNVQCANLR